MQQHSHSVSKVSSRYIALEEGLKQFSLDLNKLEVTTDLLTCHVLANPDAAIRRSERDGILENPQEGQLVPTHFVVFDANIQQWDKTSKVLPTRADCLHCIILTSL